MAAMVAEAIVRKCLRAAVMEEHIVIHRNGTDHLIYSDSFRSIAEAFEDDPEKVSAMENESLQKGKVQMEEPFTLAVQPAETGAGEIHLLLRFGERRSRPLYVQGSMQPGWYGL